MTARLLGQRRPEEVKVSQHEGARQRGEPLRFVGRASNERPVAARLGADETCPGGAKLRSPIVQARAVGVVFTDDEPAVKGRRRRLRRQAPRWRQQASKARLMGASSWKKHAVSLNPCLTRCAPTAK